MSEYKIVCILSKYIKEKLSSMKNKYCKKNREIIFVLIKKQVEYLM